MQEINLYDLIKFYGKKWRVIVALAVAGLLAGLVYNTFIQVPMYQSSSKLILVTTPSSGTASNQTLINNYIDLITSRRVLEPVVEKQSSAVSYEKLVSQVQAVNQKDTAVIDVTVTTSNATRSADIANEITDSFKTAVDNLYKTSGVIVVDPAVASHNPTNVHADLQLATATGAGVVASVVGLFFLYDYTGGKTKKRIVKKTRLKNKSVLLNLFTRYFSKNTNNFTVQKKSVKTITTTPKTTYKKLAPKNTTKLTPKKTPTKIATSKKIKK